MLDPPMPRNNMRYLKLSLFVLTSATALGAQETKSKFGLGATFNPGGLTIPGESEVLLTQAGFNNILMPIRGATATFEAELGFLHSTVERQIQTGPTTFTKVKSSVSNKRIGVGVLKHLARRENFEPYVAPRIGVIFASSEEPSGGSSTAKISATNFYVTGGAGGQYFLSEHFTLGGEVQLTYTNLGKPKVTGSTGSSGASGNSITTLGVIAIRWYY